MSAPCPPDLAVLHGFFRSSASWRVRIALNLKGVSYRQQTYHLRSGEQRGAQYIALNPQGLVPTLEIDGAVLTQSLAICEFLDETIPGMALLPADPFERARVRAFAQVIACDIHPVQNLKILQRLEALGLDETMVKGWARDAIGEGLAACEQLLPAARARFCFGEEPTLADICLVPQLANARRFGVELDWPELVRIEQNCMMLPAFTAAAPSRQPDALAQ